jgi:hypothetical protein
MTPEIEIHPPRRWYGVGRYEWSIALDGVVVASGTAKKRTTAELQFAACVARVARARPDSRVVLGLE